MLKPERQNAIVTLVTKMDFASVKQISEQLDVSEMTIRRDLEELAEVGRLTRVHGGARSIAGPHGTVARREYTTSEKHRQYAIEKEQIAQTAARLVQDGDTVFLGAGTTCEALARALANVHLRAITNSIQVFSALNECNALDVILIGGEYRPNTGAFVGGISERSIEAIGISKAFVGTNGVHDGLIFCSNSLEGSLFRMALNRADARYVVTDSSKMGKRDFYGFYDVVNLDGIVTDAAITEKQTKALSELTEVIF